MELTAKRATLAAASSARPCSRPFTAAEGSPRLAPARDSIIAPAEGGQTWYLPFSKAAVPELHIADGWLLAEIPADDDTEVE